MIHDVVVVGGGMAGLTAAAFSAKEGHSVLLLEKEAVFGGLIGSFTRKGFTYDVGIRAIEDSGIVWPMLRNLGLDVKWNRSHVSLGIGKKVIPVETAANLVEYEQLLVETYPEHHADIKRILADVRMVMKHMEVLYGVENPAFKDLFQDREYLFKVLLPWLGKFILTIGKINGMNAPVEDHLARFTRHQPLIDIICQHFFKETPAFFAMSYFSLYLDYRYPVGGTGALPRAVAEYGEKHGVQMAKGAKVVAVDPVAHKVTDEGGGVHGYRNLIWAADQKALYRAVQTGAMPMGRTRRAVEKRRESLEAMRGGDSVFTLYLGSDLPPSFFKQISHGHCFYTPRPEGLGDTLKDALKQLLSEGAILSPEAWKPRALAWVKRYLEYTTYEISIPVLKDPTLAPPGQTGLILSLLFEYDLCRLSKEQGWYGELKTFVEETMIDVLESSIYPGLRKSILDRMSYTPVSIAGIVGSSDGAITGWAFTNGTMPAVHKMQFVSRSVLTPMNDVYQAGQWTFSPAGLPMAILTGKLAADRAHGALKKSRAS